MPAGSLKAVVCLLAAHSVAPFQAPMTSARPSTELNYKKTGKEMRAKYPNSGTVQYVLTKDAPPYGAEGDVLKVKRGFAVNYLTAKELGIPASEEVIAAWEVKRAAAEAAEVAAYDAAAETAQSLIGLGAISVPRAANEDGDYGELTAADVLQVIGGKANANLSSAKVKLPVFDGLGDYTVTLQLLSLIHI